MWITSISVFQEHLSRVCLFTTFEEREGTDFCLYKAREPHIYLEYNPKISSGWLKMQIALKLTCKYYFCYIYIYLLYIYIHVYI